MQVIIPMAGTGQRFQKAGYNDPKPLLDVAGLPLIERLLENFPADWSYIFICNSEHLKSTALRNILLKLRPKARIVAIPPHKKGPVYTVAQAFESIDETQPTIVNYCDFSFTWDANDFQAFTKRTQCDGAVLCYKGFFPHYLRETLYAYCREENGRILEIKEKGHFTPDRTKEFASSGTYYFASGKALKAFFQEALDLDLQYQGEYYVSLVYNLMIQRGLTILVYEIPFFLQWGTPEDLQDYLYWHQVFGRITTRAGAVSTPSHQSPHLLMTMAGRGSRFHESQLPKPLIPVLDAPMYQTARQFLPPTTPPAVLVIRKELEAKLEAVNHRHDEVVVLNELTAGQADSVLAGLSHFQDDQALLISACDHGLLWTAAEWDRLLREKPQVIVFGQRGYPGTRRTPLAFSYIDADPGGHVQRTSVKKPLTSSPEKELLLVGTFYFARVDLLRGLLKTLIARDIRVNGERYLDSILNLAVEEGLDTRCFETQGYLNWGTPEALAEFEYWKRYFERARS